MRRYRISVISAMGYVLVAALALAVVRFELATVYSPQEAWANIARYLAASLLVVATYLARYRKSRQGDWWFGFALGGWAYWLLTADMSWHGPAHFSTSESPIAKLPRWIASQVPIEGSSRVPDYVVRSYLALKAQAILSLFAALVGGMICLVLSYRRRPPFGDGDPSQG
jgi:hypothetical protein